MDALILSILAAANLRMFPEVYQRFIVLCVALFALFDLAPLRLPDRARNLAKSFCLLLSIALIVVVPTVQAIVLRHLTTPVLYIHDGALQTEEAIKLFLNGHDPYGADYSTTLLAQWAYWQVPDDPSAVNPALAHYAYLPAVFLGALPFYAVTQALWGWFDIRIVFLFCFAGVWLMLPHLVTEKAGALQIAFALNPLFVPFLIEGRNDVIVLFWIVVALVLLKRGHFTGSAVMMAVGCATKQTVWLVMPFYLAYLFVTAYRQNIRKFSVQIILPLAILFACIIAPFFIWNPPAFINDVFIYPSNMYPVMGIGLGGLLLNFGILPNRDAAFPFSMLALVVGMPVLLVLLCALMRRPTVRLMVAQSAGFAFVMAFMNRVFHDNYIGFVLWLGALAYFMPATDGSDAHPIA